MTDSAAPKLPHGLWGWLAIFGPGAIIASLTIGTGELIFSTRGGALFGYRILFLFVIISVLKWGLVLASSRHFMLTGVHPYERWFALSGLFGMTVGAMIIAAILSRRLRFAAESHLSRSGSELNRVH